MCTPNLQTELEKRRVQKFRRNSAMFRRNSEMQSSQMAIQAAQMNNVDIAARPNEPHHGTKHTTMSGPTVRTLPTYTRQMQPKQQVGTVPFSQPMSKPYTTVSPQQPSSGTMFVMQSMPPRTTPPQMIMPPSVSIQCQPSTPMTAPRNMGPAMVQSQVLLLVDPKRVHPSSPQHELQQKNSPPYKYQKMQSEPAPWGRGSTLEPYQQGN